MKNFKLTSMIFLLVCFCLALLECPTINAEQNEKKNICFRWAFGAMVGSENDRRLVAITRDTTLKTGDQLKLFVELKKKCFVYLIYCSGQNELHMLFPYEIQQFTADYETRKKYYIPQGTKWFELDENIGLETFYLLASAQRLIGLEALMEKYKCADPVNKRKLVKDVLSEIRKIRKRYR
ncbi:MAG: DUF4384 domain-containing protein, partial [Deltaproteobacteria bacterium]|nr:DUF4384 domain-containing protein [Deltaproteobacteria bacterium]